MRLDSRLVGRKRWLHNATGPGPIMIALLAVLALPPKVVAAMWLKTRRLGRFLNQNPSLHKTTS